MVTIGIYYDVIPEKAKAFEDKFTQVVKKSIHIDMDDAPHGIKKSISKTTSLPFSVNFGLTAILLCKKDSL